ncbi:hypothetical protein [Enterovibrio calviensis]|uniref:hypothetical protein n=1 Tax=Enterovibrio calviensis TaxID=91359 RepID=UPI000481BA19|nr:hypothetical protein [Enterovibrio calviensis]
MKSHFFVRQKGKATAYFFEMYDNHVIVHRASPQAERTTVHTFYFGDVLSNNSGVQFVVDRFHAPNPNQYNASVYAYGGTNGECSLASQCDKQAGMM